MFWVTGQFVVMWAWDGPILSQLTADVMRAWDSWILWMLLLVYSSRGGRLERIRVNREVPELETQLLGSNRQILQASWQSLDRVWRSVI